jgi:subtilisin family serine protease
MKGFVNTYLNMRSGKPEVLGNNNPGYYTPGQEVEIVATVIGEDYKGNNKWYQLDNGMFVWSGGIKTTPRVVYDYSMDLTYLDSKWVNTDGADSIVIIIDTGVSEEDGDAKPQALYEIDLTDKMPEGKGHGTFIAGVIAGRGSIRGIAAKTNVISIRFKNDNNSLSQIWDNLLAAFLEVQKIRNEKQGVPIVVNLSHGFNAGQVAKFPQQAEAVKSVIKELDADGVVILAAAGDNPADVCFPAILDEVISIGAFTRDKINVVFPAGLNVVTPIRYFKSYNAKYNIEENVGSSFSTAVMSGIALLLSSYYSKNGMISNRQEYLKAFRLYSKAIADFSYTSSTPYSFFIN